MPSRLARPRGAGVCTGAGEAAHALRRAGAGPGLALALGALLASFALGCRNDMQDQPRYEPNSPSAFFPDGTSVRPLVEGVVPRRARFEPPEVADGMIDGKPVARIPVPVDLALLERGRERYGIYCTPCHGGIGDGDGMIVQRGYRRPPSFHDERLRSMPDGYLYDVIARGFGVMPAYGAQVRTADRWAIVAYVRALQLSQNARLGDVPASERTALENPPAPRAAPEGAH